MMSSSPFVIWSMTKEVGCGGASQNISYEVNTLYNSLSSLNDTLSNQPLLNVISDIKQKAIRLKRELKILY